jgi:hypothetical protein
MCDCEGPILQLLVLQLLLEIFKLTEIARAVVKNSHDVLIGVHTVGVHPARQKNL